MRRLLSLLCLLAACNSGPPPPPPPDQVIGGVTIKGEVLADGAKVFAMRCATCHGANGDGNGPTGRSQNPKPRDFTLGLIKFASVRASELAPDSDYARIIHRGLAGTNMLALPLAPGETEAVIQYVKQLSPKWTDITAKAGTPIERSQDPWTDDAAAIVKGRELLVAKGCTACHATDNNEGAASDSVYGWLKAPKLESKLTLKAGSTSEDIYRTIGAGVGGTAMRPMKGVLSEEELWALVHVVGSVSDR